MSTYSVYQLISPDGLVYVGATRQAPSRRWHAGAAYRNNPRLWADIQKYGWHSFDSVVVETGLSEADAHKLEALLIHEHNSTSPECGYNRASGIGRTGCPASEDTKQLISQALLGKRKGVPHSAEHCENISRALVGHSCSEETRAKLRDCLGDRMNTAEAREKQRQNTPRGAQHHKAKQVLCVGPNEKFLTIAEAAGKTGVSRNGIARCCSGKQKTAGGYKWRFVT